jgi:hypothetical protein
MPKGYQPPDNAKPGEPFEVVATMVQTEDGEFELQAIDGQPLDEKPEDEGAETDGGDAEGADTPQSKFAKGIKLPWNNEGDDQPPAK